MTLEVLSSGLLSCVQDRGRNGWRALGVGMAGAADAYSLAVANLLVGNPADAAALEINLVGPTLRLHADVLLALCGATIQARADGVALPGWRPLALRAGTTLTLGHCLQGARTILSVAGGIDVPRVLGSRATDLRGGFGGTHGRGLRVGDRLAVPTTASIGGLQDTPRIARWWIDHRPDLDFADSIGVRVLAGADTTTPADGLHAQEFTVAPTSNRQGLRLQGRALQPTDPRERISEPVVPGTLQLPPDGQPIVLLADAQTVGGYPRIGHVITADLPRVAQRRPGQKIHFIPVDQRQAARANADQRVRLARIGLAIQARRRHEGR